MKITLYKNVSENNAINKSLAYVGDLIGTLRQATSVLNPVILIEMDNGQLNYNIDIQAQGDYITYIDDEEYDVSINLNYSIFECNYCYIEEFNRFYFIDDIVIQNNKLFSLALSVDVLESYKNKFMVLDAFVLRNEFQYDPFVNDANINYYIDKDIVEFDADKGDMVNMVFNSNFDYGASHNVALTVINQNFVPTIDGEAVPNTNLPKVSTISSAVDSLQYTYITDPEYLCYMSEWILKYSQLNDAIYSINLYPFSIEVLDSTPKTLDLAGLKFKPMPIGSTRKLEEVKVYEKKDSQPKYLIVADFTLEATSFMDYEPFTQYEIFLPYLSWIPVHASDILNNRIIVFYVVDYASGEAQVTIYDVTNDKYIYTSTTHLGVKLAFTTSNQYDLARQKDTNNMNLALGLMGGVLGIAGGIIGQNPSGVMKGGFSMMSSALQYDNANANLTGRMQRGNVSSGMLGLYNSQNVRIKKISNKAKNYNEDYFKLYGRPLYKYEKLENLKGFTTISEIHLEDIGATQPELNNIYNLLKDGVIIK